MCLPTVQTAFARLGKIAKRQARKIARAKAESRKKARVEVADAGGSGGGGPGGGVGGPPAPAQPGAPGPEPLEAPAPLPPPPPMPVGGWQRGYTYVQIGDLGWMCFNQSDTNAHCSIHSCSSQKCHADRVRFPHAGPGASRAGQGRPLGLLMPRLQRAAAYDNHSSRQCKIALGSAAWH